MALAMSQPPDANAYSNIPRLGLAAQNPDLIASLSQEIGGSAPGMLASRMVQCEDELNSTKSELASMKAMVERLQTERLSPESPDIQTMKSDLKDLRTLMTQHNTVLQEVVNDLKTMKANENDTDAEKSGAEGGAKQKRLSWNEMRQEPTEKGSYSAKKGDEMKVSSNIFQDARDSDDLTVDRWGFRQSCWDAAAFVGDTNVLQPAEACVNFFLLILNLIIQGCFVIIVYASLVKSTVGQDTQDGYHLWRTNTGHIVQFMDKNTLESMASRVCRGDRSLYLSDTQSQHIDMIDTYLYDNSPFNGPMMAMLAIYVWVLVVSKEFHVLKDMIVALASVKRGQTDIRKQKERLALKELSGRRLVFIFHLVFIRVCVAFAILFAGVMFLAVTLEIQELLLNAIALEFILNVDELLYHAMAPMKTKRLLLLMKPLTLRKSHSWQGLDSNLFVVGSITFGFTAIVGVTMLLPEMDNMEKTKEELCGGYLDFSYTPTTLGYATWAEQRVKYRGSEATDALADLRKTQRYAVVRSVIDNGEKNMSIVDKKTDGHGLSNLFGPGWSVANLASWDVKTFSGKLNSACKDVLDNDKFSMRFVAESGLVDAIMAIGEIPVLTCSGLKKYCNDFYPPGTQVRAFCPLTCGCRDPSSVLALPFGQMGCPFQCRSTPEYTAILSKGKCIDFPDDPPAANPVWVQIFDNYKQSVKEWGATPRGLVHDACKVMLMAGCGGVAVIRTFDVDICEPPDLRPLRYYCPESCGCKKQLNEMCPTTCRPYHNDSAQAHTAIMAP